LPVGAGKGTTSDRTAARNRAAPSTTAGSCGPPCLRFAVAVSSTTARFVRPALPPLRGRRVIDHRQVRAARRASASRSPCHRPPQVRAASLASASRSPCHRPPPGSCGPE
jgi:hypothetical protein